MVNRKPYSRETDVWSFGCFIYELVKGEPPFEEFNGYVESTLQAIANREPLQVPGRSEQFNDLLSQCTQKDAGSRISIKNLLKHPYLAGAEGLRELWVRDFQRY